MKKFLIFLVSVALAVFALSACNGSNSTNLGDFSSGSSVGSSESSSDGSSDSSSESSEEDDEKYWTGWH